jgi:hypothetical protein
VTSNGTTVDAHYFKEGDADTGLAPIDHERHLEYLEDDFDAMMNYSRIDRFYSCPY